MAMAAQATKRPSAVRVSSDGREVHITGGGDARTIRGGSRRDPGLVNGELDWFLRCSSSANGQRGTMSAVVSAIERGGATGGGEDPNLAMLRRVGWAEDRDQRPRDPVISRERQLCARWVTLTRRHQSIATAHYLLTPRLDDAARGGCNHKIVNRCGPMSGVVVLQWLETREGQRSKIKCEQFEKLGAVAAPQQQELFELEQRIGMLEEAISAANREYWFGGGERQYHLLYRASWLTAALQAVEAEAKPLRTVVWHLKARESYIAAAGGLEADLAALAKLCEAGDVPELVAEAEGAVRAMHGAWEQTGRRAAEAWVEA